MLIQRDERLSRATPPRPARQRRAASDDTWHVRRPRDWQKPVRLALYALLGLLGTVAALGCLALLLDRPAPHPQAVAEPAQPMAAPPLVRPAPPAQAATSAPAPAIAPAPAKDAPAAKPPAAATATDPDHAEFDRLQSQIREATAMLAALRAQTEQSRREARAGTRPVAPVVAAPVTVPLPPVPPAPLPAASVAAPAPATPSPALAPAPPPADHAGGWADAERTVQALAERAAGQQSGNTPPAPAPAAPAVSASVLARPPARDPFADDVAVPPLKPPVLLQPAPATASVLGRPAATQRPRVFLHVRGGSPYGRQEANDIAQRLLFSDFLYAETRVVGETPHVASVRYFYPEDAAMAARLAALLGGTGQDFQVQNFTAFRGGAAHGTLEVWLPG